MFATKVLTTSEGGIIVTTDEGIRNLSKVYRDQGKDTDGVHNIVFGSAWRMSELHAALGLVQLKHLAEYVQRNNEIAQNYKHQIKHPDVNVPWDQDAIYSGHKFIIMMPSRDHRDSLRRHLVANDILPAKEVYAVPLHDQPVLSFLNQGEYPIADQFSATHLCLPIWKGLTNLNIDRICATVNDWIMGA